MALTTFVDFSDPKVTAAWLNGVDQVVNGTLGSNVGAPASGVVLVGDGTSFVNKQLVAGANVTITQGVGTVTIAGTASPAPSKGVTTVIYSLVANSIITLPASAVNDLWLIVTSDGSWQLSVNFPDTAFDGQEIMIILRTVGVANMTLLPVAGVIPVDALVYTYSAYGSARYRYSAGTNTWHIVKTP